MDPCLCPLSPPLLTLPAPQLTREVLSVLQFLFVLWVSAEPVGCFCEWLSRGDHHLFFLTSFFLSSCRLLVGWESQPNETKPNLAVASKLLPLLFLVLFSFLLPCGQESIMFVLAGQQTHLGD